YRGERKQKGRYKEFYQCDIDIIGNNKLSIYNDALLPRVIYEIFSILDFKGVTFHINNRKLLNGYFKSLGIKDTTEVLRTIDKMAKIGKDATIELLTKEVEEEVAIEMVDFLSNNLKNEQIIEKLEKEE